MSENDSETALWYAVATKARDETVAKANLERQNELHRVELIANVGKGQVLVADVRGGSFLAVLDEAVDRMARQLRKHHDRVTIDRHRPRRRAS